MVAKAPATTLPQYDAQADLEIAHRKLAVAKQPLAPRSLVWPQTDAAKPTAPAPAASAQKTSASAGETEMPKFNTWVQP